MVTRTEQAFAERRPFTLGEVTVSFDGPKAIVMGPRADRASVELPPNPDAVRAFVREDAAGRYRPLSGARTMRGGWRVTCTSPGQLEEVLDAIYPLALRHQLMHARGELDTVDLETVLERQTGRYRVAASLDEGGRAVARRVLCSGCVRVPIWAGERAEGDTIPCPEPCSVLVALCREAALWEDEPPGRAPVGRDIAFAAFEEPGNEIREAYLAAMAERNIEARMGQT